MRAGSSAASPARRVWAQAVFDTGNLLRNGENLLLTLVIPVAVLLLALMTPLGGERSEAQSLVAALSLAVLATAFTSQAISTGFDRRYGVLRMLGLSPLGVRGLLLARALVSLLVIAGQSLLLVVLTGVVGGWWPDDAAQLLQAGLGVVLAVWALNAWALLLAGALRAEATLAVANAVFLLLMFGGGLIIPADSLPWSAFTAWLPTGALVDAMTEPVLAWLPLLVLVLWGSVGTLLASRFFRWQA